MASSDLTTSTSPHEIHYTATSHARILPTPHRFKYSLFHFLLDVDSLDKGVTGASLFSYVPEGETSLAVVQIREQDYLAPVLGGKGMRARVESVVRQIGVTIAAVGLFLVRLTDLSFTLRRWLARTRTSREPK
jgi:DUF1365 family protein